MDPKGGIFSIVISISITNIVTVLYVVRLGSKNCYLLGELYGPGASCLSYDITFSYYIFFFLFSGNVGGYLGIFLGASILTLTEWIEFFALAIYVLIKRLLRWTKCNVISNERVDKN